MEVPVIEKVNPAHPDKIADRIAGAIVDLAYTKEKNPKIAVEVLIGHGICNIIVESSKEISANDISDIVKRIVEISKINYTWVYQDSILAKNQKDEIRCGDNGIFRGVPLTDEQKKLSKIARNIYKKYFTDGKYILDGDKLVICQSCAKTEDLKKEYPTAIINPLGDWVGGVSVDSGATNRKLGSDMADSATGGGINGKDISKADVSVNIYAFLEAQKTGKIKEISCAIGDTVVDGKPYQEIVNIAKNYIDSVGGFEKFSEWGLF